MTNPIENAAQAAVAAVAPAAAIPAKAVGWLTGDLWRLAFAGAMAVAGLQQARIAGLTLRPHIGPLGVTLVDMEGWRPRALAAEKALAQVSTAAAQATTAQAAANHQPAALSTTLARTSDADAQTYYAKGHAAGAAYAAAHAAGGVRCPAGQSGTGHADLPGADHPAPQHDGQGDAADMVAVARADFDQLTANSLRLAKVQQDAQSLIASGLATPDDRKD